MSGKRGGGGFGSMLGFHNQPSLSERIRGNPRIVMVTLTSAGMQKVKAYGVEGKRGDVLSYIARNMPASMEEISMGTGIDMRTVQNIVHDAAYSSPPLVTVGGAK